LASLGLLLKLIGDVAFIRLMFNHARPVLS